MKTAVQKFPVVVFLLLGVIFTQAQTTQTIVLNAATTDVQDAPISWLNADNNYGALNEMNVYCWTVQGQVNINRVLIDFDLGGLPAQSAILDAWLILYFKPENAGLLNGHSGMNNYLVQRIISPWTEEAVTWNTQPSAALQNMVETPPTSGPTQNAVIEVTDLVQDMIDDPANSFGFMLRFPEETPYKVAMYASSDHADISLHPELIVTYLTTTDVTEAQMANEIVVFPNPSPSGVNIKTTGNVAISRILVRDVLGRNTGELPGDITYLQLGHPGLHLLEFHTEKGVVVKRVVVE
jgi:hypothetical protein